MAAQIIDDKSEHCVPFILERIKQHQKAYTDGTVPPFFIGLNGVQGAGKTTLVSTLSQTLRSSPYNLTVAVLSIDDLYLTHADQVALAQSHADNPLVQHRGQPGTHDLALGRDVFSSLKGGRRTSIPVYDKSAYSGQGDRADESVWEIVNDENDAPVQAVIFEGWCVGFRALPDSEVDSIWKAAVEQERSSKGTGQLGKHKLESLLFVNEKLKGYDIFTDNFNAFIQIDAEDTMFVYEWRREQEAALRLAKDTGMTDEQVVHFVNGYYPAYELYTQRLGDGIFKDVKGKQLRMVVGRDRKVKQVEKL